LVALLDGTEREHATRVPLVASVELTTGSGRVVLVVVAAAEVKPGEASGCDLD
jgi:hypothetical protein